jgi:hypothetical protein
MVGIHLTAFWLWSSLSSWMLNGDWGVVMRAAGVDETRLEEFMGRMGGRSGVRVLLRTRRDAAPNRGGRHEFDALAQHVVCDSLGGIVEDLDSLTSEARFGRAPWPGCANRAQALEANARYLLDELVTSPGRRDAFEDSPGLCFAHCELVRRVAQAPDDRRLILGVQRKAARSLLVDLQEHVRKHDDKYRHEPKGPERDSWRRAILLTAGWRSGESAAEPERRR